MHILIGSVAGSDYTAVSGFSVTFLPSEEVKTVQVGIVDDTTPEDLESFFGTLVISPGSAGIVEVTVPQATVQIEDEDSKCYYE